MRPTIFKAILWLGVLMTGSVAWGQGQSITFTVFADIPYGSSEVPDLQQQIVDHNLYSPSEFVVHLGDIKAGTSSCPQSAYSDMAGFMKELKVPVYMVPGDNEYNDCSNPTQAWGYWETHFSDFENNFCGHPATERQSVRHENFAFVSKGVLFIGINLVGGSVHSQSEWDTRMQQDADWVNQQFDEKVSQVRGAVVFGHAGAEGVRSLFFDQFKVFCAEFGKPVLYMMGNNHTFKRDNSYLGVLNLTQVVLDDGAPSLPLQMTANMDPADMWSVERFPWSVSSQPYNMAPCVDAGPNQSITLPAVANLGGAVSDDGDPTGPLTTTWSQLSGPGTVTFGNPNALATSASFSLGGTYVLRLTANDGALQSTDDVTVTVASQGPALAINDVTVNEGNAGAINATFTVTLSSGTGGAVSIDYATADATAIQGSDYNSVAGTLFFSGSTTTQTLNVQVIGDLIDEPDETFVVNLINASGAGVADPQGACTIVDDDATPPPTISSFTPSSGGFGAEVAITGANLTGATAVKFNGLSAANYTVDSDTQIRANVPSGATSGKISVTTGAGAATSADDFTVTTIGTLTLNPTEDAYVNSGAPANNYGASSSIRVKTSLHGYLKFNVTGLTGSVANARLRLNVNDPSPDGGAVYPVSNDYLNTTTPWVQSGLNWDNAPAISGAPLSSLGAVSDNTWVEFPVTAAITGNGVYSFGLMSGNTDAVYYSSKESANDPELVIDIGTGAPPPNIASFSPASGLVGIEVTITGSHFSGASSVKFNGLAASTFTEDSDAQIRATVPAGATTGEISITTGAGTSASASEFTVIPPPPVISSFTPASGPVGGEVTISGSNFTGATSVQINGTAASTFTVDSGAQIRATVAAGSTSGKISVTTLGGTAQSAADFIVLPPPAITSFTPASGIIGTEVTITGGNFTGTSSVKFNGTPASTFIVDSDAQIRATVASGSSTGKISVTAMGGVAQSAADFIFIPPPAITSFAPASGLEGAAVAITGSNFTGASSVKFNGAAASSFAVDADTLIHANVPAGATTGPISVTTSAGTGTSAAGFTVIPPPPAITSFTPASGLPGTSVTITGTNFIGVNSLKFNTTLAPGFIVDSQTQITVNVPAGASTGKISVTADGGTGVSANDFSVPPPTIASFTPSSGVVGTQVTITGANFAGVSSVKFNGTTASTFTVNSVTEIVANVPAGATSGTISVTTGGGTAISVDLFTVTLPPPPSIASFTPPSGPVGTEVTILGSDFAGASSVSFNGTAATTFAVDSETQVRANVPSGATNGKISVTTSGGAGTSANDFTVESGGSATLTLNPTDDSYVNSDIPTTNYGTQTTMRARKTASATLSPYLKFDVSGLAGNVQSAVLRLRVSDASDDGGGVYLVSNNYEGISDPWTQIGLLWTNAPAISGTPLSSVGAVTVGSWAEFNVTPAITGNGIFSFAIRNNSSDVVYYRPKEHTDKPELVIQTGSGTPSPIVSSFTPASGPAGTEVTITGSFFNGATSMTFNGVAASTFTVDSNTSIRATVPATASTGKISVTTGGGTSQSASNFTVIPPAPAIASFTPPSDIVGAEVTITGTNFTGITSVTFNVTNAVTFTVDSPTQLRAIVPAGATTGKISVANAGGSGVSVDDFTVVLPPPPSISSFTPASGPVGTEATVTGDNFTGATSVKFNATTATTFFVDSPTQIRANVPAGATTGKISVTTGGGAATSIDDFTVLLPSIASFTPATGPVGTEVTVTGNNFTGATSVKFNATTATTFFVDSPTQIRANVPAGATTGKISVTTGTGAATSIDDFIVTFAGGATVTFNPIDDSYVRASTATTNYGTSATLRQRLSGATEILYTYLKFNVNGLGGAVQSAKLRLKVVDASTDGGSVYLVSNNYEGAADPWTQTGLLWTNAPAISGTPLASAGAVINGAIIELDVTAAVTGNGIFSFGLKNASADAIHYNSKEGTTKPELVVQTAASALASAPPEEEEDESEAEEESQTAYLPKELLLSFAYPNPFNGQTRIEYALPEEARVRLMVFNALGQLISTLVDETQSPGYKQALWNGKDKNGLPVSSGIYLYTLEVGHQRLTGKVVLQQ